jgi:hypothetical protein
MSVRTDGIRSIADLRGRCVIDAITGCWHFKGSTRLWLPALGRRTSLGGAICTLITGAPPAPGVFWFCTCETRECANPAHRRAGNRSEQMLVVGHRHTPGARARMARSMRERSRLSEETIAEIRAAEGTLKEIGARFGIHFSHAARIRRMEVRAPLAAQGSSVFNLGTLA